MLESGVGRAYNVALASLPNFTLPGDLSARARGTGRSDIVTPEWTMDADGMVHVPLDEPGIGVDGEHRSRRRSHGAQRGARWRT